MKLDRQTIKPTAISLAIAMSLVIMIPGVSVNAGTPEEIPLFGTPHAVSGQIYWPNGTLEEQVIIQVTVTNNRTGEFGVVDGGAGANPVGTYQIDLSDDAFFPSGYLSTDMIYINSTYNLMWAKNETLVGGGPNSVSHLNMVSLLAIEPMTVASGGSMNIVSKNISFDVSPNTLSQDEILYALNSTNPMPNAFDSVSLGPNGLAFSSPAALEWAYDPSTLGSISEDSLAVWSNDGSGWQMLSGSVNVVQNKVTAEVWHFSDFFLGTTSATGAQMPIAYVYPGQAKVPILNLTITNPAGAADTLNYINITFNGTDESDVVNVHLWNDTNSDYWLDGGDLQVGVTQPLIGGSANFTGLGENIPASTNITIFAALDVSAGATIDNYLDLFVPALGVGMTNAGLSIGIIDPAGNTTIVQQNLTDPHVVYGNISNILGPLPNVWVNVTNNNTGGTANVTTDTLGRYDVNLGLMPGGYEDGDEIYVLANDSFGQSGWNNTLVNASNFGEQVDIYMGVGPIAFNETPSNGNIISDKYRNITIEILPDTMPIDNSTVILEVNGTIYTLANANLTFNGILLSFNTTGAVGSWSNGQIVNVTLWQANDTLGNPSQNAPFTWWFQVIVSLPESPANLSLSNVGGMVHLNWSVSAFATDYTIYRSGDKFAAWPWPAAASGITDTWWNDSASTYSDMNTYFYIVRAVNGAGESGNSSMGTKVRRTFTYNDPALNTNTNWVSLPYNSNYATLIDIVNDIENGSSGPGHAKYISGIYIWNAASQGVVGLTGNNFTGWFGNMAVQPGDAIRLELSSQMSIGQSFGWTIAGTDINSIQNFTYINPTLNTNTNWISIPYSSTYASMLDIVGAIENGTSGPGHARFISGIYVWSAATQGVVGLTGNNFTGWFGNMAIQPGDAIRLELSSQMSTGQTFSWLLDLLTQPIPEAYYYD